VLHLFEAITTFPVVVYTVLLGVVLIYWCTMLLGAVDLDVLGGAEHGGHGHVDAAGDAGDAGDGDGGDGDGAEGQGGLWSALGAVGLRRVPMTVSLSLLVIYGWLVSALGFVLFDRAALAVMSPAVFHALVLVVSAAASFVLAGLSARPLAAVFTTRHAVTRASLVGREAEVSTGRVDARFGQVTVRDGGAGLILDARHEGGEALKRGDRVIITGWDADQNVAQIESVERLTAVRAVTEGARVAPSEGDEKRDGGVPQRRLR
jgi:Protein of unknown function (DUF1449)